ncbi:MAG: LytR/AlgR family response regulator transcription factor [Ruminiclostridium sp.]
MKLLICDDNADFSEKLKANILDIEPEAKITLFPTISSLLFSLEDTGDSVDGIFLDIKNSDGNGINAAAKIKERFPLIKLVFVTGYGDKYSQDIFNCHVGFEPIAFLVKPVKKKYLKTALEKIKASSLVQERYFPVTANRTTLFINEKDIVHISSDKRKITVHTTDNSYTYYDKLEAVAGRLSAGFCRCHKSFIINMEYIRAVENWSFAVLTDNTHIPIGKAYLDNFRQALISYKASDNREGKND